MLLVKFNTISSIHYTTTIKLWQRTHYTLLYFVTILRKIKIIGDTGLLVCKVTLSVHMSTLSLLQYIFETLKLKLKFHSYTWIHTCTCVHTQKKRDKWFFRSSVNSWVTVIRKDHGSITKTVSQNTIFLCRLTFRVFYMFYWYLDTF